MEWVIALSGVVVGAALGFLSQFLLHRTQRKWALDDQKREWQRKTIVKIGDDISKTTSKFYLMTALDRTDEVSKEAYNSVADMFSRVDPHFDKTLKMLVTKWFDALGQLEESDSIEEQRNAIQLLTNNNIMVQKGSMVVPYIPTP